MLLFHGYYSEGITKLRAAKILTTISSRLGAIMEASMLQLVKEWHKSLIVTLRKLALVCGFKINYSGCVLTLR